MLPTKDFHTHCRKLIVVPNQNRSCAVTVTAVAVAATAAAAVANTAYKASQGGSTATATGTRSQLAQPPAPGSAEHQFQMGTNQLLDEARAVTENAVGQGQEIDPQVYQWLGMDPVYEDRSAQLSDFSPKVDAADQSLQTLQNNIDALQAIPKRRRTPAQRKELHQSLRQFPKLQKQVSDLKAQLGQLQTMPNRITGFNRLDPEKIPPESPFSAQNPLNQAQRSEAKRLNEYLAGSGEVDPTLKHQYDAAEAGLRARLSARFGPDYENSSVGQSALQNFARTKNEAFATWNQDMVEKYNTLAFGGAANLQSLLSGQIHLAYAPSEEARARGKDLQSSANARINQEAVLQRERGIKTGVTATEATTTPVSAGEVAGTGQQVVAAMSGLSKLAGAYGGGAAGATGGASTSPSPLTEWAASGAPAGSGEVGLASSGGLG